MWRSYAADLVMLNAHAHKIDDRRMNHDSRKIVVGGHICLDMIPTFPASSTGVSIQAGQLYNVGPAIFSTGGVVSNTGIALHRLGLPVQLVGKVADDAFGNEVLEILGAIAPSLAESMTVTKAGHTSYSIVISPPGVDRSFIHCPGTNDTFVAADVDVAALAGTRLFHFGYPPVMREIYQRDGQELKYLFEKARGAGCQTSLDMCMPDPKSESGRIDWRAWLSNVLPTADLFLPSIEEITFMLGHDLSRCSEPALWQQISEELLAMGTRIVVLKLGEQGLYLRTGDDVGPGNWSHVERRQRCYAVDVAGTTGAGDCTIAGFLAAYVEGRDPAECLQTAVAVGACSVEHADSTSGVPPLETVRSRIAAGWPSL